MTSIKELCEQGDLYWQMLKDAERRKDAEQVQVWNDLWLEVQDRIRDGDYDEALGRRYDWGVSDHLKFCPLCKLYYSEEFPKTTMVAQVKPCPHCYYNQ